MHCLWFVRCFSRISFLLHRQCMRFRSWVKPSFISLILEALLHISNEDESCWRWDWRDVIHSTCAVGFYYPVVPRVHHPLQGWQERAAATMWSRVTQPDTQSARVLAAKSQLKDVDLEAAELVCALTVGAWCWEFHAQVRNCEWYSKLQRYLYRLLDNLTIRTVFYCSIIILYRH